MINKKTEMRIEELLSEAMSDDEKNPTSKRNTLKGRNKPRKKRSKTQVPSFRAGGMLCPADVRDNSNRGKTY